MNIYNKHVLLKKRNDVRKPVPFMNKDLRKSIYKKRMLHNVYKKHRDFKSWEKYRIQRNLVNKIKKQSVKNYFMERCVGGPKSKDFWPTIKPFLTNKGCKFVKNITLNENDQIMTNQKDISDVFNNFFTNVAKDIGKDSIPIDSCHPSVSVIKQISNNAESGKLIFEPITEEFVEKQIKNISIKKATGIDEISPKILKMASPVIKMPISQLLNKPFKTSTFPDKLKIAQVVPIHKKNSTMEKDTKI